MLTSAAGAGAGVADLLIPFCEAASISPRDCERCVRKRVLVSLSFVNKDLLHQHLFGDQHMDWAGVQDYLAEAAFTCAEWLQVLALLDFVDEVPPSPAAAELISGAIVGMRAPAAAAGLSPLDSMRLCCARAKYAPGWDALCKVFVLCNLADVDILTSVQALLAPLGVTHEQGGEIVRFLPSYRHTQEQYTDAFAAVLHDRRCQTRSHAVMQSLRDRDARRERQRQQAVLTGVAFQKPSLTAILDAKLLREGATPTSQDSFAAFCSASKLASNANARLKQARRAFLLLRPPSLDKPRPQVAYYLACLPDHPDKAAQLARAVGGDLIVLGCIQGLLVVKPDLKALREIVADSHHTGAPFDALRRFRESCVSSSCLTGSAAGRRTVHWSTVLRLYLAAYCRPDVCKVPCFVDHSGG